MLELQVPGILLRSVKLPNSPMVNYGFPGFLDELPVAPGAPGTFLHGERLISAIYFLPGLLTHAFEMTILIQDRERELENARVSAKFIDPSEDCVAGDCCVLPAAPPGCRLMLPVKLPNSSK